MVRGMSAASSQTERVRDTGLKRSGRFPGDPFCIFYETKKDLLDIVVPFFKAGLQATSSALDCREVDCSRSTRQRRSKATFPGPTGC